MAIQVNVSNCFSVIWWLSRSSAAWWNLRSPSFNHNQMQRVNSPSLSHTYTHTHTQTNCGWSLVTGPRRIAFFHRQQQANPVPAAIILSFFSHVWHLKALTNKSSVWLRHLPRPSSIPSQSWANKQSYIWCHVCVFIEKISVQKKRFDFLYGSLCKNVKFVGSMIGQFSLCDLFVLFLNSIKINST